MTEDSDERVEATNSGDLYVYSRHDIAAISTEVHERLLQLEDVDDETANQASTMMHDLLTGDWQSHDSDS